MLRSMLSWLKFQIIGTKSQPIQVDVSNHPIQQKNKISIAK